MTDYEREKMEHFQTPLATPAMAMAEHARNVGDLQPDRQWLLTDYDVWVRNPHYTGPDQGHPEYD